MQGINSLFILTDKLLIVDVNECLKSPCGQGTCHNEDGYYWCECPSGLTGTYCEPGQFIEIAYSHVMVIFNINCFCFTKIPSINSIVDDICAMIKKYVLSGLVVNFISCFM